MKKPDANAGKLYHIFKDGILYEKSTARRKAIEIIRLAQAQETHYLLRSEFSIIQGEAEAISADDKVGPDAFELSTPLPTELPNNNRYHILKDGTQYGSAPTHELAIFMIQQAREHRADANFTIIYGAEEFIRYPRHRTKSL